MQPASHYHCQATQVTNTLPVGEGCVYPLYTEAEHQRWRTLVARQEVLLPGRAADEFLSGVDALALRGDRIPALADVSRKLQAYTGWRIARSPGLLSAEDFFTYLAQRVIPCTDFLRGAHEPSYAMVPDCFHDIFGHAPMLVHPHFADFHEKVGQAAIKCRDPLLREGLVRIYRYTVEFGLIQGPQCPRIYGSRILSSDEGTQHSLSGHARIWPFLPGVAATLPVDAGAVPKRLFVIHSFAELEAEFDAWAHRNGLA